MFLAGNTIISYFCLFCLFLGMRLHITIYLAVSLVFPARNVVLFFYSIFDVRISSVLSIVSSAFSSPIALKFVHIILLTCSSSLLSGYCLCLLQCKCFSAPCFTPISRFTLIKFERFQWIQCLFVAYKSIYLHSFALYLFQTDTIQQLRKRIELLESQQKGDVEGQITRLSTYAIET